MTEPNATVELLHLRHSILAVRESVNAKLDALAAQIDALLPEPEPARKHSKKDWKAITRTWGKKP